VTLKVYFDIITPYFYGKLMTQPQLKNLNESLNKARACVGSFFNQPNRRLAIAALSVLLFIGLFSAALVTKGSDEPEVEVVPRKLQVNGFVFGETPVQEEVVGTIKNQNTLTLVAQSNGPVQSVLVTEGAKVSRGKTLIQQETAYAAGNVQAVATQLASKNAQLAAESLESTVKQVSLSREQADLSRDNTENLRKISEQSISETKQIITLSEQIAKTIEDNLKAEQAGANNQATVQALRQALLGAQSGLNQARQGLRNLEYQTDTNNPLSKLADLQRQVVQESTELQLKSAQLQKDIANLNLRQAQIAQAATRVTAPISGTVEKVFVRPGQFVSPGTPVAVIKGETDLLLEISVAGRVALQVDQTKSAIVKGLRGSSSTNTVSLPIQHVSAAPVSGQLYQVLIQVPAEYEPFIFQNQTVAVTLPLQQTSLAAGNSFVPLDALFVSNNGRYVFIEQDGKAVQRPVETGEIVGTSIEIKSGLVPGEVVLLDRRVIDQQQIELEILAVPSASVVELG
jgi:RND family efflux transporter MFP subunit